MRIRTRSRGAPMAAPKILAISFAAAVLVGFLLLALPVSSADGRWHADVPRLFTATSAICVTGLDPIGVGAALSPFGLAVLTLLAQLGGIGIMTVGTFLFVAIGRTLSVTEERSVASSLGEMRPNNMRRILTGTLVFTFAWELAGAVFLAWRLRAADAALPLGKAAAHGAFFSVMSFCNAGFSLHADSFAPFLHDPSIVLCSVVLSLVGGIGFLVHANLFSLRPWYRNRIARGRLTLHSRLVLEGLLAVVALDLLVYLSLEWNGAWSGIPCEGIEVKVVDDAGNEVPHGEQGEEVSRGPHMFCGYLKNPEATAAELDDDGWFYSGDLCYIDEEGRVRINGRKKEILIRGGENISANEVDEKMTGAPGVGQHATIGMPDERMGELICTFIVPDVEEGGEHIEFIDEIPMTESGKIKRHQLADELDRRLKAAQA